MDNLKKPGFENLTRFRTNLYQIFGSAVINSTWLSVLTVTIPKNITNQIIETIRIALCINPARGGKYLGLKIRLS